MLNHFMLFLSSYATTLALPAYFISTGLPVKPTLPNPTATHTSNVAAFVINH